MGEFTLNIMILDENDPVMVVGGGECDSRDLQAFATLVSRVVAADGGARAVMDSGLRPDLVIGDMDSIGVAEREAFAAVMHPVTEQMTTDFEKCISRIKAPLIYALGFSGGRVDHLLSVLNVMARYLDQTIVLVGPQDISVLVRGELYLTLEPQTRISIMPLERAACTTEGLRWNLSGQDLEPLGMTSISNEVESSNQRISLTGLALLSVPRSAREALVAAL